MRSYEDLFVICFQGKDGDDPVIHPGGGAVHQEGMLVVKEQKFDRVNLKVSLVLCSNS